MKKTIQTMLSLILLLFCFQFASAQSQNPIWVIDDKKIDFTDGPVVSTLSTGSSGLPEAQNSMHDSSGDLIFYNKTSGLYNGTGEYVGGLYNFEIVQELSIVKVPESCDDYYLIYAEIPSGLLGIKLYYLIYNVSDESLSDPVEIADFSSNYLGIAVSQPDDNGNHQLYVSGGYEFFPSKEFSITASGITLVQDLNIQADLVSSVALELNHDGSTLAFATLSENEVYLYDLSTHTYETINVPGANFVKGTEFSYNNDLLLISTNNGVFSTSLEPLETPTLISGTENIDPGQIEMEYHPDGDAAAKILVAHSTGIGAIDLSDLSFDLDYIDVQPLQSSGPSGYIYLLNDQIDGLNYADYILATNSNAGADQTICILEMSSALVNMDATPGVDGGTWSIVSGGGFIVDINDPNTVIQDPPLGSNIYAWTDNCTGIVDEVIVNVFLKPEVEISAITEPCLGVSVFAVASPGYVQYDWSDTSGGMASGPFNNYGVSGLFNGTIYVTATDENGCTASDQIVINHIDCCVNFDIVVEEVLPTCDPEASGMIDITLTGGQAPYIYEWTGPDGFTSGEEDITGLFSGTYSVVVTDDNGCTLSTDVEIEGTPFDITFAINPLVCMAIQLQNTSLLPDEYQLAGLEWDFGNGMTTTDESPFVLYENGGAYTITLTLTTVDENGNCCTRSISTNYLVDCDCTATPSFTIEMSGACTVDVTDTSVPGWINEIVQTSWDFGDGTTLWGNTATHQYEEPGSYEICMTTFSFNGIESCDFETCQIINMICPPVNCGLQADFIHYDFPFINSQLFASSTTFDPGTSSAGYFWDFGDGTTGTGQSSLHIFPSPGTYTVCLTAFGTVGSECCNDIICTDVTIGDGFRESPNPDLKIERDIKTDPIGLKLYPNPSSSNLKLDIELKKASDLDIQIIDIKGQIFKIPKSYWSLSEGKHVLDIPVQTFPVGHYYLIVKEGGEIMPTSFEIIR